MCPPGCFLISAGGPRGDRQSQDRARKRPNPLGSGFLQSRPAVPLQHVAQGGHGEDLGAGGTGVTTPRPGWAESPQGERSTPPRPALHLLSPGSGVHKQTQTHTCTHPPAHAHTRMTPHTRANAPTDTYTSMHMGAGAHTCMCTCTDTHAPTPMNAWVRPVTFAHAYVHRYTHGHAGNTTSSVPCA